MNRLYILFLTVISVAFAGLARSYSVGDVPNVQLADSTRFVSNPDGILSEVTVRALDRDLAALRRSTTAEVAVVAIEDIGGDGDVDRFATDLFTSWGIGKADRDNGVLVLLVKDQHAVTIRTGQGAEGVVTDLAAGRIIRNVMTPRFREDDYDRGISDGVARLVDLISDPSAEGDIRSSQTSGTRSAGDEDDGLWSLFIGLACVIGAGALIWACMTLGSTRRLDEVSRYRKLERLRMPLLFMSFLSLGLALPAWLLIRYRMRKLRLHARTCPSCGTQMMRLGEEEDNRYLTPVQDAEERLNSVDYDVWLCPSCHATEIIPYVNRQSAYTECPACHGRTRARLSDRVVKAPTTLSEGRGVRTYSCRHCGRRDETEYKIPRVVVAPPVRGMGRGGGGFGGGFGGGSFGGGSTMGGGATGRW